MQVDNGCGTGPNIPVYMLPVANDGAVAALSENGPAIF